MPALTSEHRDSHDFYLTPEQRARIAELLVGLVMAPEKSNPAPSYAGLPEAERATVPASSL